MAFDCHIKTAAALSTAPANNSLVGNLACILNRRRGDGPSKYSSRGVEGPYERAGLPALSRIGAATVLCASLGACGGGGGNGVRTPPPQPSADQRAFESFELHGGTAALGWNFPYGGGNLIPGSNYIVSYTWSGRSSSHPL